MNNSYLTKKMTRLLRTMQMWLKKLLLLAVNLFGTDVRGNHKRFSPIKVLEKREI